MARSGGSGVRMESEGDEQGLEAHSAVGKEGRQVRDSNASSDGRPGATEIRKSVALATPSFVQISKAVDIAIFVQLYD